MYKLLFEKFLQQFIKTVGRKPQTTKELMSIQDDVVRYINKTKGVPEGSPKPPFQGFKPTVIEGGKSKKGIDTLFKDSPERIAKMKADNKAAIERLKKKKKTVEDFSDDGDFDPGGMASGGLARVGMFSGGPIRLAKGASWVINKLKEQLFDLDLGIGGSRFSKLSSTQKEGFKNELKTLIKQLEQGGEIPNEMLDTMIADPKFKSVVQTRSTDKELVELEDALLDRQAGKQSDELFGADGKLNKKAVLQEVKDSEEKMLLDRFNVKDRKPNASGGLANILGV